MSTLAGSPAASTPRDGGLELLADLASSLVGDRSMTPPVAADKFRGRKRVPATKDALERKKRPNKGQPGRRGSVRPDGPPPAASGPAFRARSAGAAAGASACDQPVPTGGGSGADRKAMMTMGALPFAPLPYGAPFSFAPMRPPPAGAPMPSAGPLGRPMPSLGPVSTFGLDGLPMPMLPGPFPMPGPGMMLPPWPSAMAGRAGAKVPEPLERRPPEAAKQRPPAAQLVAPKKAAARPEQAGRAFIAQTSRTSAAPPAAPGAAAGERGGRPAGPPGAAALAAGTGPAGGAAEPGLAAQGGRSVAVPEEPSGAGASTKDGGAPPGRAGGERQPATPGAARAQLWPATRTTRGPRLPMKAMPPAARATQLREAVGASVPPFPAPGGLSSSRPEQRHGKDGAVAAPKARNGSPRMAPAFESILPVATMPVPLQQAAAMARISVGAVDLLPRPEGATGVTLDATAA